MKRIYKILIAIIIGVCLMASGSMILTLSNGEPYSIVTGILAMFLGFGTFIFAGEFTGEVKKIRRKKT